MTDHLPDRIETMDHVRAWDAAAERFETPCGAGHLAWRKWGLGPTVIFCHGGSGSWTHWCRTIPVISKNHTVYTVDLAGLGDSALPCDPSHPAGSAEALNLGIRQLIPREDNPRIVAFSFGCHISTLALAGLGDYIRDFLIIGTSALGFSDRPVMDFPKERPGMTADERNAVHRGVLEMLMFHRPERIDDLAIALQADNVSKARFRSRIHANTDNVKRGLKRVQIPVRCIWGEHDVVAYPNLPTVLATLSEHHPELKVKIIPDAGHWVMFEQADVFNAALSEMLSD